MTEPPPPPLRGPPPPRSGEEIYLFRRRHHRIAVIFERAAGGRFFVLVEPVVGAGHRELQLGDGLVDILALLFEKRDALDELLARMAELRGALIFGDCRDRESL